MGCLWNKWTLLQLELYCAKDLTNSKRDELLLVLKVVMNVLLCAENPNSNCVFFDNASTNCDILIHIRFLGYPVMGTIRKNHTRHCTLKSSKELRKQVQGTFDYQYDHNG
jgi:hypothetical protein